MVLFSNFFVTELICWIASSDFSASILYRLGMSLSELVFVLQVLR